MEKFGLSPEAQAQVHQDLAATNPALGDFVVDTDNWPAVRLFLSCRTQWQHSMAGGVTGLRYESVIQVIALYEKKSRRELFESIQLIEQGALSVFYPTKSERKDDG